MLNTAVHLVAGSSRRDNAFSLLRDRHWLPVKQRVEYKLRMMVHRWLYGDAPSYLLDLITSSADAEVVSDRLHSAQSQCHEQCHRSATGHSLRLAPAHGTDGAVTEVHPKVRVPRMNFHDSAEQTATTTSSRSFCCCF